MVSLIHAGLVFNTALVSCIVKQDLLSFMYLMRPTTPSDFAFPFRLVVRLILNSSSLAKQTGNAWSVRRESFGLCTAPLSVSEATHFRCIELDLAPRHG